MIFPGNAKDAKAVQVKAREKAKVVQACTEGNTNKNANVNEARKEANSEIREADTRLPKSAVTVWLAMPKTPVRPMPRPSSACDAVLSASLDSSGP